MSTEYTYVITRSTDQFYKYGVHDKRNGHDAPYVYLPKSMRRDMGNPLAFRAVLDAAPVMAEGDGFTLLFEDPKPTKGGKWKYTAQYRDYRTYYYITDRLRQLLDNPTVLRMRLHPLTLTTEDVFPELES